MHVCFEGWKPRFRSNYRVGAFVPSRIVHFSRHEEEFKKPMRSNTPAINYQIGRLALNPKFTIDKSKP